MATKRLLIVANGLLWLAAGINILRIGILAILADGEIKWFWSLLIFTGFATMFVKLMKRNTLRINSFEQTRVPLYKFMTLKSYIIVIVMISLGITLRKFTHLPESFFAFFYTGLGSALGLCGLLYLINSAKKNQYLSK